MPTSGQPRPKSEMTAIPFNQPSLGGKELMYLEEALASRHLSGDGLFTKRCHKWLEETLGTPRALLTHSCTAALEMSALLADLGPGDEVIMPSFTFVSTANAVVLRGATPVFVDIRPDTLNIDESKIEPAVTKQTKAIFVVHYAGVACEMETILAIARKHRLLVVEDAAQALMSFYQGRPLGSWGDLAAVSFHETKNVVSGEGGALLINARRFQDRAEILREKGTNRSQFFRGQVDKYTWVDVGSSFLPSELNAAVLLAQLEAASDITRSRREIWRMYHEAFADLEMRGRVRRPFIPASCQANGHIYYLITDSLAERSDLIAHLRANSIAATFHYVPLHSAPAGRKYGRTDGPLATTDDLSDRLIRLPLFATLDKVDALRVIETINDFYQARR